MAENARPGSADEQPYPVAVAVARLLDEEANLLVAEGELATEKRKGDRVRVAEAKVAVAEAKVAVAEAKLRVAEGKLEQARQSGDQAAVAKQEAAVAKQEAAVAEAKVAVAEAKVAVAEAKVAVAEAKLRVTEGKLEQAMQSGDQAEVAKQEAAVAEAKGDKDTVKAGLDRAIRGLELAQEVHARALYTGAVPASVGAAATHRGAEGDPFSAFLQRQEQRDERLELGMAAVADLVRSMRYRAMCPDKETARTTESQVAFKRALVARYQAGFCRKGKRFIAESTSYTHIQCAVTGWKTDPTQCCAGHLLPHASAHDALVFGLSPDDINDERNGLLLAQGIEKVMHPPLQVCFLFDVLHNSWVFAVLDPELMNRVVLPTRKRFHELHRKKLEIPQGTSPWKRLLWVHAEHAITSAMKKGWIRGQDWEVELKKLSSLLGQVNGKSDSDMALRIWVENSAATAEGPARKDHDPI